MKTMGKAAAIAAVLASMQVVHLGIPGQVSAAAIATLMCTPMHPCTGKTGTTPILGGKDRSSWKIVFTKLYGPNIKPNTGDSLTLEGLTTDKAQFKAPAGWSLSSYVASGKNASGQTSYTAKMTYGSANNTINHAASGKQLRRTDGVRDQKSQEGVSK